MRNRIGLGLLNMLGHRRRTSVKEDEEGCYEIRPRKQWVCCTCGEMSPVVDWKEVEVECDSCGEHEGRQCPKCHSCFEIVWGFAKIEKACQTAGI